jgi:hypothetical protein
VKVEEIAAELTKATRGYFGTEPAFSPRGVEIRFGIYAAIPSGPGTEELGLFTVGIEDERAKRLGIKAENGIFLAPRRVTVSIKDATITVWAGRVLDAQTVAPGNFYTALWEMDLRADMVVDDLDQLRAATLPFAKEIDELEPEFRRTFFRRELERVRVPHDCVGWKDTFHQTLTGLATYRRFRAVGPHDYYAKWEKASSKPRVLRPPSVTDAFLQHTAHEAMLIRDRVYLALEWNQMQLSVYQLSVIWKLSPKLGGGTVPVVHSLVPVLESASVPRGKKPARATLFYTNAGPKDTAELEAWSKAEREKRGVESKGVVPTISTFQAVVDPVALIREVTGQNPTAELRGSDAWDKFAEMVRVCFPERTYDLDITGNIFLQSTQDAIYRKAIAEGAADSSGVIRAAIKLGMSQLPPNVLVLAQGYEIPGSRQRFIGFLDGRAFLRDLDSGVVTSIPTNEFSFHLSTSAISAQVYRNTQAMIPFCKLVVWGGLVAMLPATNPAVFRFLISDELKNVPLNQAMSIIARKFRHQIIAMVLNGVMVLLPIQDSARLRFLRGCLRGLATAPIANLVRQYAAFANGPKHYRWFKMGQRAYAAVRRVQKLLHELRNKIDEKVSENLAKTIEEFLDKARTGVAVIVGATLFIDYRHIRPVLEVIGEATGSPIPSEKEWNTARIEALTTFLQSAPDHLARRAELAKKKARDLIIGTMVEEAIVVAAFVAMTRALFGAKVPALLIGALLGALFADQELTGGGGRTLVADAFSASMKHILNSPAEAEKVGELLGTIIGGALLDKALFTGDSGLARFAKVPVLGSIMKREVGHGTIGATLKLVFHHYITVFLQIKSSVKRDAARLNGALDALLARDEARAATLQTYADFISKPDREFSIEKLKRALSHGDELLMTVTEQLAAHPDLPAQIERLVSTAGSAKNDVIKDILNDPTREFKDTEAYLFLMFGLLHIGVTTLIDATKVLHRKLDPDGSITLHSLLELIGLNGTADEVDASFETEKLLK